MRNAGIILRRIIDRPIFSFKRRNVLQPGGGLIAGVFANIYAPGAALPLDGDAQGLADGAEREIGGAVQDKGLDGVAIGVFRV